MSRRGGNDDIFDDDDFNFDDDFSFEDQPAGGSGGKRGGLDDLRSSAGDDFVFDDEFGDDSTDISDDDFPLGTDSDEPDFGGEEAQEGGGPNRVFIFAAIALVGIVVLGLVLILALSNRGPDQVALSITETVSFIETNNAEVALLSTQTELANIEQQTAAPLTETALSIQLTSDAVATQQAQTATAEFEAQETASAQTQSAQETLDAQQDALIQQQTADAQGTVDARATSDAGTAIAGGSTGGPEASPTQDQIVPPEFNSTSVALTATALFQTLQPPTPGGGVAQIATPTPDQFGVIPTQLPEGGLFDDFVQGSGGMGVIALMAFGLVGVIIVSRRLRVVNERAVRSSRNDSGKKQ